jgi:hypothetical protein
VSALGATEARKEVKQRTSDEIESAKTPSSALDRRSGALGNFAARSPARHFSAASRLMTLPFTRRWICQGWIHAGEGTPAQCWFKSSPRLFEPDCHGLMTVNTNMTTGVKIYQNRPCWARHIFNLKFCTLSLPHTSGVLGSYINQACLDAN